MILLCVRMSPGVLLLPFLGAAICSRAVTARAERSVGKGTAASDWVVFIRSSPSTAIMLRGELRDNEMSELKAALEKSEARIVKHMNEVNIDSRTYSRT